MRNVSNEDEQGWKSVKGRKETNAPIETQIMMKEVNSGGGTRFDALEVTMNSEEDFPVLMADIQNEAAKETRNTTPHHTAHTHHDHNHSHSHSHNDTQPQQQPQTTTTATHNDTQPTKQLAAQFASTRENSPGLDTVRIDRLSAPSPDSTGGGAWPSPVGGVICLVISVNERDLGLLNHVKYDSYLITSLRVRSRAHP